MSNFYAEGVDLKVAEKYRVPPRIAVSREVITHVCSTHYQQVVVDSETEYDFNMERNIIAKIDEWKRVHEETEHRRQEQLRASDRERRQKLEQEQKHLLNQVSYPSAADLSSSGDEEEEKAEEKGQKSTKVNQGREAHPGDESSSVPASSVTKEAAVQRHPIDFSTILQPTVVPESQAAASHGNIIVHGGSSLPPTRNGGTCSGRENRMDGKADHTFGGINYSDWESDNYSPFDRMELKSINDLDILAQVLQQTTQLKSSLEADNKGEERESPGSPPASPVETNNVVEKVVASEIVVDTEKVTSAESVFIPNSSNPIESLPVTISDNSSMATNYSSWTEMSHPVANVANEGISTRSGATETTFPAYPHQNQMYGNMAVISNSNGNYYNSPIPSTTSQHQHQQQYQSNIPTSYVHTSNHHYPQYATSSNCNGQSANFYHHSTVLPHHNHSPSSLLYQNNNHSAMGPFIAEGVSSNKGLSMDEEERKSASSSLLRSRSKSVPDIVNELEEEVKASEERRRVRNHSQCNKSSEPKDDEEDNYTSPEDVAYDRLPQDSKELAVKISKMGFSVNVVAAVIEQLGNDDKKIVEHLIPLCELLDLGFGISPTSEALLKFNNNRERALDFLIS